MERNGQSIPLLNLVEALEKGNRDENDNGLPAVANLDLKNPGVSLNFDNILAGSQCPTPLRSCFCLMILYANKFMEDPALS